MPTFTSSREASKDEMAREIDRCHKVIADLEARLARVPSREDGSRPLPYDRETLGRFVREAWVRWAQTQPNPKPSWLAPYDDLSEPDKEADRQIGEAVARWTLIGDAASSAQLARVPSREEVARAICGDHFEPWDLMSAGVRSHFYRLADAVLALFAAKQEAKPPVNMRVSRERLREQIEADPDIENDACAKQETKP